ncbi:hypothetical protein NDA14_002236 [Ustilago hordei]|nr:hypothetical protein NDA14_002236 [Ustilago hordei]
MVEETKTQAGSSKAKGGRKGKAAQLQVANNEATNETETKVIDDDANEETDSDSDLDSGGKQYNFCTLAKLLKPMPKLTSHNYYSWNAHIKSFLQCVPHAMKHLEKCTICHPMYKEMVTTINQLTFSTLATTLTIQQSVIKNNPAQRVKPHQASARVTGSNDQDKPTRKDEKDKKDEDHTSAKVAARPQRI